MFPEKKNSSGHGLLYLQGIGVLVQVLTLCDFSSQQILRVISQFPTKIFRFYVDIDHHSPPSPYINTLHRRDISRYTNSIPNQLISSRSCTLCSGEEGYLKAFFHWALQRVKERLIHSSQVPKT